MTHRTRFQTPLLLVLALTALAACGDSKPEAPSLVEVQFEVTVPPETPVDGVYVQGSEPALIGDGLKLTYQSGTTFTGTARLPTNKDISYTLHVFQPNPQVALDAAGVAVPASTFKVAGEGEKVSATVERWGPAAGGGDRVAFIVTPPANTPADAHLYLAGNQTALGGWNADGARLFKAVEGRYATNLAFEPGAQLEYKVTRGTWATVEKGAQGEELENRTHTAATGFARVAITVQKWADIDGAPPPPPLLTGNIEYVELTPTNTTLKPRKAIVWLPPQYAAEPERRFPVLYMHDGQNLMDASTGFNGEWGVDEVAQQLIEAGQVEPLIIVGIYNTADRIPEYTQVPDPKYGGGKADLYGAFLVEEVKPLIDTKYRTRPEAQNTGLAGSSLGGLVSMYLGMKHSTAFTRLGVISPSVWWANRDIVTQVNALPAKLPLRIWVDIGTAEANSNDANSETVADTQLLRDALVNKGWVLNDDLKYTEVEGGKHTEQAWNARFGDILKYLYPPQ